MNQIKNSLFELPRRDLKTSQFILVFAAVAYPAWYYGLQWMAPGTIDSLPTRLMIGGLALAGFFWIHIRQTSEREQNLIINFIILVILTHYHWVLFKNDLNESVISADTLLIACIGIIPTNKRWSFAILGYTLALTAGVYFLSDASFHQKNYFLVTVFTILVVVSIVQLGRIRVMDLFAKMEIRQRTLINNLSEGILLFLPSKRIEICNSVAKSLLETDQSTLTYEDLSRSLGNGKFSVKTIEETVQQCLASPGPRDLLIESELDGKKRWLQIQMIPFILDSKKSDFAVLASVKDITDEKQAKLSLENQNALLAQNAKMAALGEMAGGVAHEIMNPLAVLQLLSKKIDRESQQFEMNTEVLKETSLKLNSTVQRIAKIIQGLKTYTRNDSADKMEPATALALIDDTLAFCQESFKNASIKVTIEKSSQDPTILCHKAQISQIILNLLHNSKDAMDQVEEKKINIKYDVDGNHLLFSIEDSGPGVPLEIRHRIMQTFFTTKKVGKGTGLGLSISKTIAEQHGGTLYLDETSRGNRFILKLPLMVGTDSAQSA